jgi:hypothetical protein
VGSFKNLLLQNHWANFKLDLAQIILGCRGFKVIQTKGIALFQGEIIAKKKKYAVFFKKNLLQNLSRPNSIKYGTNYPWMKGV